MNNGKKAPYIAAHSMVHDFPKKGKFSLRKEVMIIPFNRVSSRCGPVILDRDQ